MSLSEYNKKRDFSKTSEPIGRVVKKNEKLKTDQISASEKQKTAGKTKKNVKKATKTKKNESKRGNKPAFVDDFAKRQTQNFLRFVIQEHHARAKHFDLRLEWNGVLLSWAVPKGLSNDPSEKRLAVMVEDHPLEYIDFEGVIPKGNYGAGIVEIFDKGCYFVLEDMTKGLKKGHIRFVLQGEKLKGEWSLVKTQDKNWIVVKAKDEFSGKDKTEDSKTRNPFEKCEVQLATLAEKIPQGKDWIFEIKYDGYRILAFAETDNCKLMTRNGQDYSKKFDEIAKSILEISKKSPFVLDGEVVAFDENGRSDFGLLQDKLKKQKGGFFYVIFDILAFNGKDFRQKPLEERKQLLHNLLQGQPSNLIESSFVVGKGKESFELAKKMNLEGIVAKKIDSIYGGKRNENWLKIKCYRRQEFVVLGYATSDKNNVLSAILLGYYKNKRLCFVGKVGTGFSDTMKKEIVKKLQKIKIDTIQAEDQILNLPKFKNDTVFVEPKEVVEVQFTEFTKDGVLRQPSFVGFRIDKDPKQVKLEVENEG